jgi:AraC family transcriptional regulator, alkane utilization regulator
VGYGGEAALSRAFRAHTGQSPREWRKAELAA